MGAIPYYLSAGAVVDLLVTAHHVEELACRIANIETVQKRPRAKLLRKKTF